MKVTSGEEGTGLRKSGTRKAAVKGKKLIAGVYEGVGFWIARNDKTKHDGRKWNI